jgi:hypothetical protein
MNTFKKTTTALLVASAMICSACSTVSSLIGSTGAPAVGFSTTLKDEKAFYVFRAGYYGALLLIDKGVNMGIIKGQLARDIRPKFEAARNAHRLATAAHEAGNATQLKQQVELGFALVADLQATLSKNGVTPQ